MPTLLRPVKLLLISILFLLTQLLFAQDKIYRSDKTVIAAKVVSVGPTQVRYTRADNPDGPGYGVYLKEIDSIVYANGVVDNILELFPRVNYKENIKLLNTWSFNPLGFAHLSACQSYERRLKNGIIGFRVPFYIGFEFNLIAGVGLFVPGEGYGFHPNFSSDGAFNMSVGFNPKFYVNKHRIVRFFAGPEVDLGFSIYTYQPHNNYSYSNRERHRVGTFAALGAAGLSINPKERFNITIHGGAGAGNLFGIKTNDAGWIGVWQIGVSLGTNF